MFRYTAEGLSDGGCEEEKEMDGELMLTSRQQQELLSQGPLGIERERERENSYGLPNPGPNLPVGSGPSNMGSNLI